MITGETGAGRRFHHNGDYSGEVWVNMRPDEVEAGRFGDEEYVTVKIPMEDLLDIVGEYVRMQRIQELESVDVRTLLT